MIKFNVFSTFVEWFMLPKIFTKLGLMAPAFLIDE
jgi:hypothetical protein